MEQQYLSNVFMCEYLDDIRAIYAIVDKIGNLQCILAASADHFINYQYVSSDQNTIERLHAAWREYLADGVY